MIVYVTKLTAERYKINVGGKAASPVRELTEAVINREGGNGLFEWGAKLFYFDRRKCLEVANFASKFTLFLVDVRVDEFVTVGDLIAKYMLEIYHDDPEMSDLLQRYFQEAYYLVVSALKGKSAIAHLNHALSDFALDGNRLYEYIEGGILQTVKFNREYNKEYPVTKMVDGKRTYVFPADTFKELLKERYLKTRRAAARRSPFRPR